MITTNVNANVAAPAAQPRQLSPEEAILLNSSVVARPLMAPEICAIHVKNAEYRYRWVNRLSQNGRVYMQRKAQGFMNATADDVDILGGDASNADGGIIAGDLILMRIRADIYDAALKHNMENALRLQRTRGVYLEGGSVDPFSDANAKRVSVAQEPYARSGGKAEAFIPENAESIINDSINSGRVEQARATVDKLRDKK